MDNFEAFVEAFGYLRKLQDPNVKENPDEAAYVSQYRDQLSQMSEVFMKREIPQALIVQVFRTKSTTSVSVTITLKQQL